MSFNAAATRLAVSSSNRTIHIFDVSGGSGSGGGERGRAGRRPNTSPKEGFGDAGQVHEGDSESSISRDSTKNTQGRRGSGDGSSRANDAGTGAGAGGGGLASGLRSVVGMLPNRVTKSVQDYVDCNRSFANVRLRGGTGRSICALIPAGDGQGWAGLGRAGAGERGSGSGSDTEVEGEAEGETLLVVTNEGILYSYAVDTVKGGECRLEQASSLLMDPSASQEIGSELFVPERQAPPVLAGQG